MSFLNEKSRVISLSIVAAILTLGMKFTAYYLTDSVGLLGDAAESLVNLVAALLAFSALVYAARPADRTHAYGHDKIEYFASGAEGTLIVVAAAGIVYSAVNRLVNPVTLHNLETGLLIALVASGVNLVVARILLKASRTHDSITLEADAKHLLTDVWTTIGVLVSLGVAEMTGLYLLDPIIALALAANIVFSGIDLLRRSFRGLMDYTLPAEEIVVIDRIIRRHNDQVQQYHNLRTRKAGPNRFIDFHILMPGKTSVQAAHDLCESIEAEIERKLRNTQVTIHVEPIEDKSSWDAVKGITNSKE